MTQQQPNAPQSGPRFPFPAEDAHGAHGHNGNGRPPTDHLRDASARLAEIKDYASYYVAAKLDSTKSSLKSAVLYAVLGLLAAIAGTAILATAGVLVVLGMAQGLTLLFNYAWVANLVTGLVLLGLILGGTYLVISRMLGASRAAMVKKYEAMKRQQFAKHGHDVHERATEAQHA